MKIQHISWALILMVFAFLAAGCSSTPGPEEIYWQYWDACTAGRFSEAEKFLSESSSQAAISLGSCAFTHDAINTVEAANGNPPRTFSEDPEVTTKDDNSMLSWFDDQGNIAIVILRKENDTWKIVEATWSK